MSRRFPLQALWLLTLIPGNVVVLLDLQRGVVRPAVWLARFVPALLVLAVVLWAHARTTRAALRVRTELRHLLASGLLLSVSSGAALCVDVVPAGGPVHALVRLMPWVLAVVLPAAAVLMPMSLERERGTLTSLLLTPLGARTFAEKFGLAAGLVVLSWLVLSVGEQRGTELWWFALAGHVLALATVPTWFFLTQDDETSLGFIVLVPFFIVMPAGVFWPAAVLPVAALYAVVMLALLPAALRRGVAAGAPAWLRKDTPGFGWLERLARPVLRAELHGQRDCIILGGVAVLSFVVLGLMAHHDPEAAEVATLALFVLCGVAAVLSPALAFTEARRLGTLDAQLAVQPRRRVFIHRALVSAATTVVVSGLVPAAGLAATSGMSINAVLGWSLAMVVLWSVGLVVAVHLASVGTALVTGLGVAFSAVVAHVALLLLALWGAMTVLDTEQLPPGGPFISAALVVVAVSALVVAWRRFNVADRLEPRVAFSASAVSLGHAAVLGAASVIAGMF